MHQNFLEDDPIIGRHDINAENDLQSSLIVPDRIPVIDMKPLLKDDDPKPVAEEILSACQDLGFFYIYNHEIDHSLQTDYLSQAKQFFSLPLGEKMKSDVRNSTAHRGYFPLYGENNDPDLSLDLKEGFDVMAEHNHDDPRVIANLPFHGPNQWPENVSRFKSITMRYYNSMTNLATRLMQAIAVALKLPSDFFSDKLNGPLAMLRMLHYPSQEGQVTPLVMGTGAHTDYGLLTILLQDKNPGLQVCTPDEGWVTAPPLEGTFVVNLGDELQRWSNDQFKSTPHRVINVSGKDRYASPFFFHAAYDTLIDCLPGCCNADGTSNYAPIRAGDYMWSRFLATFSHYQSHERNLHTEK